MGNWLFREFPTVFQTDLDDWWFPTHPTLVFNGWPQSWCSGFDFFFEVNYSRDPVVGSPVGKISAGLLVHWWNSYQGISRLSSHLDGDWWGLNSWGSDVSNLSSENSSKSKKHLGLRYLFLHLWFRSPMGLGQTSSKISALWCRPNVFFVFCCSHQLVRYIMIYLP